MTILVREINYKSVEVSDAFADKTDIEQREELQQLIEDGEVIIGDTPYSEYEFENEDGNWVHVCGSI